MSNPNVIITNILTIAGITAPGKAEEYAGALVAEGFDSQEALVLLKVEDLDAVGMKRGHKRLVLHHLSKFATSSQTHESQQDEPKMNPEQKVAANSKRKRSNSATTVQVKKVKSAKPLTGTAICVSGQMSLVRKQFWELLKAHGAIISSSVSGSTTHLVTTASEVQCPTRKTLSAISKHVPIVSEEFVQECIRVGDLVDESPFLLYSNEEKAGEIQVDPNGGGDSKAKAEVRNATSSPQESTLRILTDHAKRKLDSNFTKMSNVKAKAAHARKASAVILAKKFTLPDRWSDFSIDHKCKKDVSGWWLSEKLDGVRAYWSGTHFYSRNGNIFPAPEWFTKHLPNEPLDGELWCGRRLFQRALSIVKNSGSGALWKFVSYQVFDAPEHTGGFEERYEHVKALIAPITALSHDGFDSAEASNEDDNNVQQGADDDSEGDVSKLVPHVNVVGMVQCKNLRHLLEELKHVEAKGGEGLMLREPKSKYAHGQRTGTLLKVKTVTDEEAIVVGHEKGKGKYTGRCGALTLRTPDQREFSCGSGMTDDDRTNPPAIGAMVTYRYTELMNNGYPRFPVFVGEREDIDWDEYVKNYEPPSAPQGKGLRLGRDLSIMYPQSTNKK